MFTVVHTSMGDTEMSDSLSKMMVEEYNEDDDEDYVQESKKSSNKRVIDDDDAASSSDSDDLSSSEEEEDVPKVLKPKSTRIQKQSEPASYKQPQDQELEEDVPPQQRLSEFDAAQLALKKSKKPVELSAQEKEEMINHTLREMRVAYEKDLMNRKDKKPAMEKLKHLESVLVNLNNKALATMFVDMNVGEQLVSWLKPSRKYLPNARIRTELIKVCDHMPFPQHDSALKDSKLGKMLNYYATYDDVFANRTLAARIVKRWMDYLKSQKL
ncbi:hypothetical protein BASA81_007545 [Batrachochytrium salamandrivorans]|nr:hypothetical protein BASA81_007545 [Batrachochytrium salamandrivorans]